MTRINAGIPPSELCDKHLLAELREITRIPNTIKSGKAIIENIPEKFKLGTGHVKHFYNKCLYLKNRYEDLRIECLSRGFGVSDNSSSFLGLPDELMNDWVPNYLDIELIRERIEERKSGMKSVKTTKK